jgi:hypothetical protein
MFYLVYLLKSYERMNIRTSLSIYFLLARLGLAFFYTTLIWKATPLKVYPEAGGVKVSNSKLCKVDCYGILKDLLDKGFKDRDLYLSFREQYLQLEPKCFCDFILKDLLAEGKEGYELLQSFQEKQVLVAKGYKLVYEKGSE